MEDEADQFGLIDDFSKVAKKKKKTKKEEKKPEAVQVVNEIAIVPQHAEEKQEEELPIVHKDYSQQYQFLLERIVKILNDNNPKIKQKIKISMKPPNVERIGKQKTSWTNFTEICEKMQREQPHVQNFFATETGCECMLQGEGSMLIKGKYVQKQIEQYIKKYMQEYVSCHLCKSPNTNLVKDKNTRLYIMECCNCKATRTVTTITAKKH